VRRHPAPVPHAPPGRARPRAPAPLRPADHRRLLPGRLPEPRLLQRAVPPPRRPLASPLPGAGGAVARSGRTGPAPGADPVLLLPHVCPPPGRRERGLARLEKRAQRPGAMVPASSRSKELPMIKKLSLATVWVTDQDRAHAFYTEKLGFEV